MTKYALHNIHSLAWDHMLVGPQATAPACPCVKTALVLGYYSVGS